MQQNALQFLSKMTFLQSQPYFHSSYDSWTNGEICRLHINLFCIIGQGLWLDGVFELVSTRVFRFLSGQQQHPHLVPPVAKLHANKCTYTSWPRSICAGQVERAAAVVGWECRITATTMMRKSD